MYIVPRVSKRLPRRSAANSPAELVPETYREIGCTQTPKGGCDEASRGGPRSKDRVYLYIRQIRYVVIPTITTSSAALEECCPGFRKVSASSQFKLYFWLLLKKCE